MNVEPANVLAILAARGETLAVCESLTGGALGAELTAVPGSSSVFRGGLVTYATELKATLAGVEASLVAQHGVVSRHVALAMAHGVRNRCDASWGVATSGVAGPTSVDGHRPGTVWIAVEGPTGGVVRGFEFDGDRSGVRAQSVTAAVALLAELVVEYPNVPRR